MEPHDLLPKRVVNYIHDIGVRSLQDWANRDGANRDRPNQDGPNQDGPNRGETGPFAVQTLVQHWKSMSAEDKERFVESVAGSVMEVIVASATLPLALKAGKKTVKVAKKAIRKQRKAANPPKKDEGKKKKKK